MNDNKIFKIKRSYSDTLTPAVETPGYERDGLRKEILADCERLSKELVQDLTIFTKRWVQVQRGLIHNDCHTHYRQYHPCMVLSALAEIEILCNKGELNK